MYVSSSSRDMTRPRHLPCSCGSRGRWTPPRERRRRRGKSVAHLRPVAVASTLIEKEDICTSCEEEEEEEEDTYLLQWHRPQLLLRWFVALAYVPVCICTRVCVCVCGGGIGHAHFYLRPLRSHFKNADFSPQISNKIFKKYKISYRSRRIF